MQRRALRIGPALFVVRATSFLVLAMVGHGTQAQGDGTLCAAPGANCGGASPCYAHPQEAADAVSEGDTIKVAPPGVYTGVSARVAPPGYPYPPSSGLVTQTVYVSKTLTLRGGYATTNWPAADPLVNPNTLDARGGGGPSSLARSMSMAIRFS